MSDIFLHLEGCDDSTFIKITEEEAVMLQPFADRINDASTYGCMPTMYVERPGDPDYAWAVEQWEYQKETK